MTIARAKPFRRAAPQRERGTILIMTLMFLVLMTIVGVASISTATLEEKMGGNLREQYTAFQAAESALRDAEIDLETGIGGTGNRDAALGIANNYFATLCSASFTNGVCTQPASPAGTYHTAPLAVTTAAFWSTANKSVAYGTYTGATKLCASDTVPACSPVVIFRQPRYVIEYLAEKDDILTSPTTRYFRISARGWGANATTAVTLQTIYKMPLN